MSLEAIKSDVLMDEMSLEDAHHRLERLGLEIHELTDVENRLTARLESLSTETVSLEAIFTTQDILNDLFGTNEVMSMEAIQADQDLALQMTTEGLRDALKTIADSLKYKYEAVREQMRWMRTNMFSGLEKKKRYLRKLEDKGKNLGELNERKKFQSSPLATNYLHLNGHGDADSVLEGLEASMSVFKTMSKYAPLVTYDVMETAKKFAKQFQAELKTVSTGDEAAGLFEMMLKDAKKEVEQHLDGPHRELTKLNGTQISGGRMLHFEEPRRKEGTLKLDLNTSRASAPGTLDLPNHGEIQQLLDSAKAQLAGIDNAWDAYEQVFDFYDEVYDEMIGMTFTGKKRRNKKDAYTELDHFIVFYSIVLAFYFGCMAVVYPMAGWIGAGFLATGAIKLAFSIYTAIDNLLDDKIKPKQAEEKMFNTYLPQVAGAAHHLTEMMMKFAKFQNSVMRGTILYVEESMAMYDGR